MFERLPIDENPDREVTHVERITALVGEDDFRITVSLTGFHVGSNRGLWRVICLPANADGERSDYRCEHDGDGDQERDTDNWGDGTPGHIPGWLPVLISTFVRER